MNSRNDLSKGPSWIVPVFIPHLGCPHRCVFCNQHVASRVRSAPGPDEVRTRLEGQLPRSAGRGGVRRQVAFYGGSFTGLDPALQRGYLLAVRGFLESGRIDSVRVSARPDGLGPDRVAFLREHGVGTVEVGVQSLSDRVLDASRRGYDAALALEAVRNVRQAGLEVGAQVMAGLPGDTGRESLETVDALCGARPDFARIYPLLVLRGTGVARMFRRGRYKPLDLPAAVALCAAMVARFRDSSVPVVRIGLHQEGGGPVERGGVLAGPTHPSFGFLVQSFLYRQEMERALGAGPAPGSGSGGVWFRIHPNDRPLFSGYRRENLRMLEARTGTDDIVVAEDPGMRRGRVERLDACGRVSTGRVPVLRSRSPGRRDESGIRRRGR